MEVADASALLSSPASILSPRERIDAADALTGYYKQRVLPLVQKTFTPLSYAINRQLTKLYYDRGILFEDFPQDDLWDVTMVVVDKRMRLTGFLRPDANFTAEEFERYVVTPVLPRVPISFRIGVTGDKRFVTAMTIDQAFDFDVLRGYTGRLTRWRSMVAGDGESAA